MYIINKVVEDYEGTWSNALMYDTDLNKAMELVNELQAHMLSLKTKYLNIHKQLMIELKKSFPYYGDYTVDFDEQIKNINSDDSENYFDKEQRILKQLIDQQLNENELFLYDRSSLQYPCKLMYFEVEKIKTSEEAFAKKTTIENKSSIIYSTKNKAKEHSEVFEQSINE